MQYGFIKVCAATPEIRVADVDFNSENIIKAALESSEAGSQLTVFPELCVCGYTCGDLFNQTTLLKAAEEAVAKICLKTSGVKTLLFIGAPVPVGGKLYNCAVAVCGGKILGIVPKTYLPNYGEFYEMRHFSRAESGVSEIIYANQTVPFGTDLIFTAANCDNFSVAAEICEDLWAPLSPSVRHTAAGATIVVNLSCSDETVGKAEYRRELVKMQSAKLICGYVYADAGNGESSTDMTFAGHNLICENASVIAESKLFENGLIYGEIDVNSLVFERRRLSSGYYSEEVKGEHRTVNFQTVNSFGELLRTFDKYPFVPAGREKLSERLELILSIQTNGLAKRLKHTNAKCAIIGVSGGLDSALALLVTCRAFKLLGKPLKDIIAVTMPGFGTTTGTKSNSLKLIEALSVTGRTIPIGKTVKSHFSDIGHNPEVKDVTYENAQARMRTLILMDIANSCGGLVIGTGDLSELALGWATYNGDHMSMYGVNCSVPKTLVKYLVKHEAENLRGTAEKVLNSILATEISPELLPPDKDGKISQKTEDIIGPYSLHDFFLYYSVRRGFEPEKVLYLAARAFADEYDAETIEKWLRVFYQRFFSQQFKRSCIPDGVKVGSVTLSPRGDWRMPSDAAVNVWLDKFKK